MSIPTLDPLDLAPVAPFTASCPRDPQGGRTRNLYRVLAWTGVIVGLALLETTLPAHAAPRGANRSGALHRAASPPPPPRFVPSFPGRGGRPGRPIRGGRGTLNGGNFNGGYPNNGYVNNGNPNNGYVNNGYPNGGYVNNGYPNGGYVNNGNPNGGYQNNDMSNGARRDYNGGGGSSNDATGGSDNGTGSGTPGNGGSPSGNGALRSGAISRGSTSSTPVTPPVVGKGNGLSHLDAALQDLLAAEQMESSATPDVVKIKIYLATASQEIQTAGARFGTKRHQAMVDIQNVTLRLGQGPSSSQALGLTGDAINNVMDCLQMSR